MNDFRQRIWDAGLTLREVSTRVGCEEAHFHRAISGKIPFSTDLAKRTEAAAGGLVRAWELLGLPDGPAPVLPSHPDAA